MLELRTIPGAAKRSQPGVAVCIVSRDGRQKYLSETLKRLRKSRVDILLWMNGGKAPEGHYAWLREFPVNVGQHVAHNEMLDECVRRGYDWHVRVDDDCWLDRGGWLARMLKLQEAIKKLKYPYSVISPTIDGLEAPPESIRTYHFDVEVKVGTRKVKRVEAVDHVKILGGIFRLSHMSLMRYFRWDERQAMGYGDATQFSSYCEQQGVHMLRMVDVHASHGGATWEQSAADRDWEYEHDMLQYIPLGL